MKKRIRLVLIGIIGVLCLLLVIRNIQYVERGDLDVVALNSRNGDIVFTRVERYPIISLYDCEGNKLFSFYLDNVGGILSEVWFDEEDHIHVFLGRKGVVRVYDREGTFLRQYDSEFLMSDAFSDWTKEGSSYSKEYGENLIRYDYQNELERIWRQKASLTICFPDGEEKEIWSNQKTSLQGRILSAEVCADKNPSTDADPGRATQDKVFLLSIDEVKEYFPTNESRMCVPTEYAEKYGAHTYRSEMASSGNPKDKQVDGRPTCWWWLRTPSTSNGNAAIVTLTGSVRSAGRTVTDYECGVRPAMWITVE